MEEESTARRLVEAVLTREDWQWIATPHILREYFSVLEHTRFRNNQETRDLFERRIRDKVDLVEATDDITLPADPTDAKFLNAAAAGEADYLITSDRHLLEADPPGNTRIVKVSEVPFP